MGGFTSGGGTTNTTAELTPEQRQSVALQNEFQQYLIPQYKELVGGIMNQYNQSTPGVTNAAQNLATTANQAQNVLGTTGQSAVQTGISGLENLFSPDYEKQQLAAVMTPAQAQYQQNLTNQSAQFGGAGNLGSARSALAQTQLAGTAAAQQQAAAAQVERDIAAQRLQAGQSLAGIGQAGLGQSIGAAQTGVGASGVNMDKYVQLMNSLMGVPSASYGLGPTGTNTNTTQNSFGIKI
jgi:hypothetical protein